MFIPNLDAFDGEIKENNYSIFKIFPLFVVGFLGMIFVRNIGDQILLTTPIYSENWLIYIKVIKFLATTFLTMAMVAVGLSINLIELKEMGYKPFVMGLIAAITVGIVCIGSIHLLDGYFDYFN